MTVHQHVVQLRGKPAFTVNAIQPAPGLYVYRGLPYLRWGEEFHWHISHHSGLIIASAQSAIEARQVVDEIADLADWTLSPEEIKADASVDACEIRDRIVYRTDAVFHQNHRKAA
ncbi:hypothetical protein [Streptomyces virginiae]|uniref:hypothetical protein n=1 Tax=Streptomyces virginiae TaxID=1961 RepID=UPI002255A6E7|nr:hypothetical protein [Streptomyces virginiae]MCX5176770.1 hypothetical protein [Streptomyces virginiae]